MLERKLWATGYQTMSIVGQVPLIGSVRIQGSMSCALTLIPITVARPNVYRLENVPNLSDTLAFLDIFEYLGGTIDHDGETLVLDSRPIQNLPIPRQLTREATGTFQFAGALLARFGEAELGYPGGDLIGGRAFDTHLGLMNILDIETLPTIEGVLVRRVGRQTSDRIVMPPSSTEALINTVLAASADDEITFTGIPNDTDIEVAAGFMATAGIGVEYDAAARVLHVAKADGNRLSPISFVCPSDRDEAVSWAMLSALSGGNISLREFPADELGAFLSFLTEFGVGYRCDGNTFSIENAQGTPLQDRLVSMGSSSGLHPEWGQAISLLFILGEGRGRLVDTKHDDRYRSVLQLRLFGAEVSEVDISGSPDWPTLDQAPDSVKCLEFEGKRRLHGATVAGADVRGSFAMLAAALLADGNSVIGGLDHLARGYSDLPQRLRTLGGTFQMNEFVEDFTY